MKRWRSCSQDDNTKKNERDCRTIVQQLVSSITQEVLTNTSYKRKEQGYDTQNKTVTFEDQQKEGEEVDLNLEQAVEAVLTWKAPRTNTQLMSFLGFANYYREFIRGYADKVYPMQKLMRNKGKKFEWSEEAQAAIENIKRDLCEAPVLGMPTEEGMYVLDTDASVVAILGILRQEQERNGRTVLRPIAYGSRC